MKNKLGENICFHIIKSLPLPVAFYPVTETTHAVAAISSNDETSWEIFGSSSFIMWLTEVPQIHSCFHNGHQSGHESKINIRPHLIIFFSKNLCLNGLKDAMKTLDFISFAVVYVGQIDENFDEGNF